MGELFNTILIEPIINLLVLVYKLLSTAHVPFAFGFSIIALTALIRLILFPLTASQLKSSKKMQDLNPHIQKLKEKHKTDAKMLQSETMKLYKEHGVNPVAGCLPLLVQLPFIWALYSVLDQLVKLKPEDVLARINGVVYADALKLTQPWDTNFFGVHLGESPSSLMGQIGFIILLLPLLTGLLQFLQSKMLFLPTANPANKADKKNEDFATAFQKQSAYIFPLMIGALSFTFPIGLSLYWNTFTIFGIIQQYQIQGWGGLSPWIGRIKNGRGK